MTQSNDGWIFDAGDIVARIGMSLKWVVTARGSGKFMSGKEFYVYHTCRLDKDGKLGHMSSLDREMSNSSCVKVGKWDFDGNMEVDDEKEEDGI